MNQLEFEVLVREQITRDGIEDLLTWLATTDFYTAPASTKYHGAEEGGLLAHSISVFRWLSDLTYSMDHVGCLPFNCGTRESRAIVSLFHDICKVGAYKISYRNVKNCTTGQWETVPYYTYNPDTFGAHGAKSVYILNQFIKLTEEETVAILHHMGAWDKSTYSDPGKAYTYNHLAWLLHVADEAATYISCT